jgi:CheY-like chemotaxis protein
VLSHELRTPLNAIVGYARLLRGGIITGDKADRGLEALERNANALSQIVEDVLDISRIVSGKMRLDFQPVKLAVAVHNAIATVQPAAEAKGLRLETIVDPGAGPVSGDIDRLQQVIWNLLANAVKFTPRGGTVQVRVEQISGHVEVAVTDTGIGIAPEFLPYVFERFRQADAGPTRNSGGLGLGLSIVQHIVEMHGGTVKVESGGIDHGSTFRVRLPLPRQLAEPARASGARPPDGFAVPGEGPSLDGIRVMVVDDEDDALGLIRAVLEAAGAEVIAEPVASTAVARVAASRPDVLVVDLDMPGTTGFELISQIRESGDAAVRQTPAAALAVSTRADTRTRALRSGFEAYLAKPVDPVELVASLAMLVRRSSSNR